jgi:hypothetical protein
VGYVSITVGDRARANEVGCRLSDTELTMCLTDVQVSTPIVISYINYRFCPSMFLLPIKLSQSHWLPISVKAHTDASICPSKLPVTKSMRSAAT